MHKRGAIELSFSTIVILVLAMTMLILGLVLIRSIFSGATSSVTAIDQKVKNEINKLFSEDNLREIVIYPSDRIVKLKQGAVSEGFAFSVRNLDNTKGVFKWTVEANDEDLKTKCGIANPASINAWIVAGRSGSATLAAGNIMPDPELVLFNIPKTATPCSISLAIKVLKDNEDYTQGSLVLTITPG